MAILEDPENYYNPYRYRHLCFIAKLGVWPATFEYDPRIDIPQMAEAFRPTEEYYEAHTA